MERKRKAIEFNKLSNKIQTEFLQDTIYNNAGVSEELDRRPWGAGQGGNDLNVPIYMRNLIYYTDDYRPIWTNEMLYTGHSILTKNLDNENISPTVYPNATSHILKSIKNYPVNNKEVCTVGSISPWVESILLYSGAIVDVVDVIDYNPPVLENINNPRLHVITNVIKQYDCIVSYSSIEHSGLGRYGDDIDPDGDIKTMNFFHSILKPNGLLFLAVPLGEKTRLEWNHHRIYGPSRFEKLTQKFKLINLYGNQSTSNIYNYFVGENNWQNQPVCVFQKKI
jgi:hypothetical protein